MDFGHLLTNTVSWQCERGSWPRNVSKVGYAVTLRACSVSCRYLAVTSKGWYGYGRSKCGRAAWRCTSTLSRYGVTLRGNVTSVDPLQSNTSRSLLNGFFCLLVCSFWVFFVLYYGVFCLYVATNFFCIPVFCPKLEYYLGSVSSPLCVWN